MIDIKYLAVLFLACFFMSTLGTYTLKKIFNRLQIIDVPGERRSHSVPTPRGGGMAIVGTFLIAFLLVGLFQSFNQRIFWGLLLSSAAISALGFLDDLYTLPRTPRILAWIGITALSILFGIHLQSLTLPIIGTIHFGILSPLVTFLWLIGVTNFFNFMDGINGLAGFEALLVSGFLAGIAYWAGNVLVFIPSVIVFAAALGFLPHNFPKAKIFMGDGGSNFLGYIFAGLAIIGSQDTANTIPFVVPVILLLMFLLDAASTLLKRLPKGKEWLEPHRDHLYQRLIKLGYSHAQVTLGYTAINLFLGIMAILYFGSGGYLSLGYLGLTVVPFLALVIFTVLREKRYNSVVNIQ
ncbi:MAG TPA: glycosyltransferase family 4 protein [Chloroflexi bacterium]|nr:glycosyltransferase family 4 protein [Chloroflexota bacterium]